MTEQFTTSAFIPALPMVVYVAWTDGALRTAITGQRVESAPLVGRTFSVDDGFIAGANIDLEPGRHIVQAWRTRDFPDDAPDSRVTVNLLAEGNGTRLNLTHQDIPDGTSGRYRDMWNEQVFRPMQEFFVGEGVMGAPADAGVAEVNRLVSKGEAGIPAEAAQREPKEVVEPPDDGSVTAGGLSDPGGSIGDVNAIGTYASMPGDKPRPGDDEPESLEDPDDWWGHLEGPKKSPGPKPSPKRKKKSSKKEPARSGRKARTKKPGTGTKKPGTTTKRKPAGPKRKKKK